MVAIEAVTRLKVRKRALIVACIMVGVSFDAMIVFPPSVSQLAGFAAQGLLELPRPRFGK